MNLDALKTIEIIEVMENYIEKNRPEEKIREQLDLAYKIENQSIIIFEIRPFFMDSRRKIETPVAKITYVKKSDHWKVFWQRANLKWNSYEPKPFAKTLQEVLELIEDDKYGCFWG